ncbi:hypothetical protein [Algoriphagus mannitolivorans]|uniref:hypothetical protein n=1 Tax=Algoriphagus mannitolivorans TaxID=226504 RepID=UPI000412CBC6|nr:hypothetical protein [Algoriphagus mannitolivorans]
MRQVFIFGILTLGIWSCGEEKSVGEASGFEVELEWVDSVVVDSFYDLTLAAVDAGDGRMIFKDRSLNLILLTDLKGEILDTLDIKGEAPNQVALPVEMIFDQGNLIVKDLEGGMPLNFFNQDFKIIQQSPPLSLGTFIIEFNLYKVSFSLFRSNGKTLLVGTEANSIEPEIRTNSWQMGEFYSHAKAGFVYDSESDSLWRFNSFPENWGHRKAGEWKGYVFPFVQALEMQGLIGILPPVGNQFFLYRWENQQLIPVKESLISHPDRNDRLDFNPNDDYFLYPSFSDLKAGSQYFLIQFHTEIPVAVRDEYQARNPNYRNDPEFNEAFKKYWKYKYIIVNQFGESFPLKDLPIQGNVHYFDKNDMLYIKPKSEVEMDYNVFYRYKVKSPES